MVGDTSDYRELTDIVKAVDLSGLRGIAPGSM
jgi:hypothetical protein